MVKEIQFLNEKLSIYSCFIDVLYTIWDGFWRWHLMSSAAYTRVKGFSIQLVLRELLLRIELWVFE